jgi:drug/metabolite transporter (DMT)-like permease
MTPSSSERWTGLGCLLVTAFGWGLNWPALKQLMLELPPLFARGVAGLTASVVFVLVALVLRQDLRVPAPLRGRLLTASLVNVSAWMGLSTVAMQWLTAGQGAVVVYTMPVWATLLAWPVLGHRPTVFALGGLALSMTGLLLFFGGNGLALGPDRLLGVALALSAALIFAFGTVAMKPLKEIPPFALLAWQLGLGSLPIMLASAGFENPRPSQMSTTGWLLLGYMTAVPMGLCYLAWFAALRRLKPAMAAGATLLTPVIGVCSGAAVLGEPLGLRECAALAMTVGGVGLVIFKGERQ